MKEGFVKIATAVPVIKVADCAYNVQHIVDLIANASDEGASIVIFPELIVTGSTCGDLFSQQFFVKQAESALDDILSLSHTMQIVAVVGMPISISDSIYNCAVVICEGEIKCIVPQINASNNNRWFTSGKDLNCTINICGQNVVVSDKNLFSVGNAIYGVTIGDDESDIIPRSAYLSANGANIIIQLASQAEIISNTTIYNSLQSKSNQLKCAFAYTSSGYGESTTDNVYSGRSIICEIGEKLSENERFISENQIIFADVDLLRIKAVRRNVTSCVSNIYNTIKIELQEKSFQLTRCIEPMPFIPKDDKKDIEMSDMFNIQINGLSQRIEASYSKCAIVGISGGLDSTLALLVAVAAMDKLGKPRTDVVGVTMPGFGTTGRTYNNALNLMKSLGITMYEICIKDACLQHFKDLNIDPNDRTTTFENSQARERTQILMDLANKLNGLVVGTGDMSELALGWATYNGDHMSMYGVNAGVPKTLVRALVVWLANSNKFEDAKSYLLDIVDTPISPELLPADNNGNIAQKTEDLVGPYELHDFFMYNLLMYGYSPSRLYLMARHAFVGKFADSVIKKWLVTFLRRFFNQQFKRSCMPDGPQVVSVSLSPRGAWLMPSDAQSKLWLDEANNLD